MIKTKNAIYVLLVTILMFVGIIYLGIGNLWAMSFIPGWHISIDFTYFYIASGLVGFSSILLYLLLSKRAQTIKSIWLIMHVIITVPLWIFSMILYMATLRMLVTRGLDMNELEHYMAWIFYVFFALLFITQVLYWILIFKLTKRNVAN